MKTLFCASFFEAKFNKKAKMFDDTALNGQVDLYSGSRPNPSTPIERICVTSILMAIAMLSISVIILEMFEIQMCMTLTLALFEPRSNVNMPIESPYSDLLFVGNNSVCLNCRRLRCQGR